MYPILIGQGRNDLRPEVNL